MSSIEIQTRNLFAIPVAAVILSDAAARNVEAEDITAELLHQTGPT